MYVYHDYYVNSDWCHAQLARERAADAAYKHARAGDLSSCVQKSLCSADAFTAVCPLSREAYFRTGLAGEAAQICTCRNECWMISAVNAFYTDGTVSRSAFHRCTARNI
eukprot:COSAG02_NODE_17180_length_1023_cov_1.068182_1_plen_108_part_10